MKDHLVNKLKFLSIGSEDSCYLQGPEAWLPISEQPGGTQEIALEADPRDSIGSLSLSALPSGTVPACPVLDLTGSLQTPSDHCSDQPLPLVTLDPLQKV